MKNTHVTLHISDETCRSANSILSGKLPETPTKIVDSLLFSIDLTDAYRAEIRVAEMNAKTSWGTWTSEGRIVARLIKNDETVYISHAYKSLLGTITLVDNGYQFTIDVRSDGDINIKQAAYDLYRAQWLSEHIEPEKYVQLVQDYYATVQKKYDEGTICPPTLETYIESLYPDYPKYETFCKTQYKDPNIITPLLGHDDIGKKLINKYYDDTTDNKFATSPLR